MKFKESILMALRDLNRRKGRTILTSLGITIGTLLIVTMVGLGIGLQNFMVATVNDEESARQITVLPYKNYDDSEMDNIQDMDEFDENYGKVLDNKLINKIKETNKVETIIAQISFSPSQIKYKDKEYSGNLSCVANNEGAEYFSDSNIENVRRKEKDDTLKPLKYGEKIEPKDGEVVVGEEVVDSLDTTAEDILNHEIEIIVNEAKGIKVQPMIKKVKVVGVIDKNFDLSNAMILSINDLSDLKGYQTFQNNYFENNGYERMVVLANDVDSVESLSNEIKDLDFKTQSSIDAANSIKQTIDGVNTAFAVLGVIVLIVAAIGIVNTMSMAVLERTKSIGIMKSLGANTTNIRQMFLVQSSLIGFIGGVFGILLGTGLTSIAQYFINLKVSDSGMNASVSVGLPWYMLLLILVFAMIIALVSGIYPANKASKLDPIEALRR